MSFHFTPAQFPDDGVFPLVVFGHQRPVAAEPAQSEGDEMLRVVDDGPWRDEEMAVVGDAVLHETAVLEMGVERFSFLYLAMMESQHVELVVNMLKDHLFPTAVHAVKVICLFRLGSVVEWPL